MIAIPHFASPLDAVESNHPRTTTFSLRCLALSGLALIRRLMCVRHRSEQIGSSAGLFVRREVSRLASVRRLPCEFEPQAERLAWPRKFSVAVVAECEARRGHRGCVCSLGERRDGDQRDKRESSDKFPQDTSPFEETLSRFLQQHGDALAVSMEIGLWNDRISTFEDSFGNQLR